MAGFSFGKAESAKMPDNKEVGRTTGGVPGVDHFSHWDRVKGLSSGFSLDKLRDPYYTDKAERIKVCPLGDRFISGVRGDGLAVPRADTEAGVNARALLDTYGLKGIEYKNGFPIFKPVAFDSTEIGMTKDLKENYKRAYPAFAEKWSAEKRDGKDSWSPSEVKAYIKERGLTIHECEDRKTCQLVPMAIHKSFKHIGGREECKQREAALNGEN